MKIYIYNAGITPTLTDGEYQMQEIDLCEYGEEWNGDVLGYIENAVDDADIRGEEELGSIQQNFGSLDPISGSIFAVFSDGEPSAVYWASTVKASWIADEE